MCPAQVLQEPAQLPRDAAASEKSRDNFKNCQSQTKITPPTTLHEVSVCEGKTKIKINRANKTHYIGPYQSLGDEDKNQTIAEIVDTGKNKVLSENLAMLVKKHEIHTHNLQLASECSDHLIEAYDVLVALHETPLHRNDTRRATVESIAKHLITRLDMATNVAATASGVGVDSSSLPHLSECHNNQLLQNHSPLPHHMAWDDSSGYSHTTR